MEVTGLKLIVVVLYDRYANGDQPTAEIRKKMQKYMQSFAAVFRTQETLEEGCKLIDEVYTSYRDGLQV